MKRILTILILIPLLLTGCTSSFYDFQNSIINFINDILFWIYPSEHTQNSKNQYTGGSEGLTLKILYPTNNAIVPSSQEMQIELELENKGEEDIYSGNICIAGLDRDIFQGWFGYAHQPLNLLGKTIEGSRTVKGEKKVILFGPYDINLDSEELPKGKSHAITATARYPYSTKAIVKACVEEESGSEQNVCTIERDLNKAENLIQGEVSAAPIQIEYIKQLPSARDKIAILIKVSNKMPGRVYDIDLSTKDACSTTPITSRNDQIIIKLTNYPGSTYSCNRLKIDKKNEGETMCIINNINPVSAEHEFLTELSYGYEIITSSSFKIQEFEK